MSLDRFDPVDYTVESNKWLLIHLGEPWVIAGRDIHPQRLDNPARGDKNPIHYPDGVVPAEVKPIIDRVYELEELRNLKGEGWIGLDELKGSIVTYIEQAEKWAADKRRGAPRFPSLHTYDAKGRPHRGGPGADSGKVKTYFNRLGERLEFAVELVPSGQGAWVADWADKVADMDQPTEGLKVNHELARWECFCGHTEKFKEDSRSSFNAARARMSKHLRTATDETSKHREIHTVEFGTTTL